MPRGNELLLGGLSKETRRQDLEDVFTKYGRITRCDIKYVNGYAGTAYGFIGFEDERDADDAIKHENGRKICGQTVIIERSKTKPWNKSSKIEHSRTFRRRSRSRSRSRGRYRRRSTHSRSRSRSMTPRRGRDSRELTSIRKRDRSRSRSRSRDPRRYRSRSYDRYRTRSPLPSRSSGRKRSHRSRSKSYTRSPSPKHVNHPNDEVKIQNLDNNQSNSPLKEHQENPDKEIAVNLNPISEIQQTNGFDEQLNSTKILPTLNNDNEINSDNQCPVDQC